MKRTLYLCCVVAAVAALSGCTERPQALQPGSKLDAQAFSGAGAAYTSPGWKPGDKTSWEQHLKTRTQQGQNEYNQVAN